MKLLPRTLFGRILMAMFGGLLAVQAVGVWLMLDERARFGERLIGEYVAQRIAGILVLLDDAQPAERPRLVRALSTPVIRLTLDEAWQPAGTDVSEDSKTFLGRIERELDRPVGLQVLSIRRVDRSRPDGRAREEPVAGVPAAESAPPAAERAPGRSGRGPFLVVTGQARLKDATVVTFRRSLPQPSLEWPLRALGLLAVFGLFVAVVAGWAMRRLTRPLASLADAASGLARDLNRPPLPEGGPQEVTRAAQAFNAMQRDLRRMLETRAQALAGVSHDLRLPLTRMRLRLERLPEDELRARLEEDIAEMDAMIGSTLEYLRAGSAAEKSVRLNLNALVDGVVADMEALGARIRMNGTVQAPVLGQPQAIRRCIANLLENARRYGGGEIDLKVAEAGERIEIRIEDRGPGIPAADFERVFEPYVRLEASRAKHTGGTGLGLAIARATARANGGDIVLSAREGGGLSVLLHLPRYAEEPVRAAPAVSIPVHQLP